MVISSDPTRAPFAMWVGLRIGKCGGDMSRAIHRLTTRSVESRSRPGCYPDGAGLFLQVAASSTSRNSPTSTPSVTRSRIFPYTLNKRTREMGRGSVRDLGLAEARSKAAECRRLVVEGQRPDPRTQRSQIGRDRCGHCADDLRPMRHGLHRCAQGRLACGVRRAEALRTRGIPI